MADIIKIIKTIPGIDAGAFERALKCDKFWEACIELPRVSVKKTGEGVMSWDVMAHLLLDPLGVTKVPIEVRHEMHYKEDQGFKGEGKKWIFWTENSNAVNESVGELFFKPAGKDVKLMLQITKLDLKSDFVDIAGFGKAMATTRLDMELKRMIKKLIEHAAAGTFVRILDEC